VAEATEHGRLIAAAAKRALSPLGLKRVGRSRCWIADHRFWFINVEFQPSGFRRGSSLNVGVVWLWWRFGVEHRLYDYGDRINGFIKFESTAQFVPLVEVLANEAATEVQRLRGKFCSINDTARELAQASAHITPLILHGAIAAGITGDIKGARQLFEQLERAPRVSEYQRADGARLAALLDSPLRYRSHILETIADSREACRLPPDPGCFDEAASTR
jgi:hypothetical protein